MWPRSSWPRGRNRDEPAPAGRWSRGPGRDGSRSAAGSSPLPARRGPGRAATGWACRERAAPLAQVADLGLEERARPLELRDVAPSQRGDGLAGARRQIRLVEAVQLLLDLAQLVRHAVERAHVGGVQDRQQRVDARGGGHDETVSAVARAVKAPPRAGYTVLPAGRGPEGSVMKKTQYRVVILGSGPAGLTAALYASRANLEPLVVEGGAGEDPTDVPGGQLMLTTDVDNYPGFPEGILGPEMMEKMREQAARFGTEYASGALREADLSRRPFAL